MSRNRKSVVLLVDDKRRDLRGSVLIAQHLQQMGMACHLEPLGAYQAVLGLYRPDMIVFNHLFRDHLTAYSKRLHEQGVLVAVLLNEGLLYHEDLRRYNSQRHYEDAVIDLFFCWNEPHRQALLENGWEGTKIDLVGPPRFDLYFPPYREKLLQPRPATKRPRVLVCSNFVFAQYLELPRETGDHLFAQWKDKIPLYRDYWPLIECNHRCRSAFLPFLTEMLRADKFDITLKPHPKEDREFYRKWLEQLPAPMRRQVTYAPEAHIVELILNCDLQIACETCTTTIESWIARKPTIELAFEKHPRFYHDFIGELNPLCERPEELVPMMEAQLRSPAQESFQAGRQRHLARWCASPDGRAAEKVARGIGRELEARAGQKRLRLGFNDYRRGLKLRLLESIGETYYYDPLLKLKYLVSRKKFGPRIRRYDKSIKPRDVAEAWAELKGS